MFENKNVTFKTGTSRNVCKQTNLWCKCEVRVSKWGSIGVGVGVGSVAFWRFLNPLGALVVEFRFLGTKFRDSRYSQRSLYWYQRTDITCSLLIHYYIRYVHRDQWPWFVPMFAIGYFPIKVASLSSGGGGGGGGGGLPGQASTFSNWLTFSLNEPIFNLIELKIK